MPDVTCEQIASFTTMQVAFASSASRLRRATDSFDVRSLLPAVRAPTLVVHARSDAVQPIEQAQSLTAGISGAELLVLETGITPRYRRIPHAKPPLTVAADEATELDAQWYLETGRGLHAD
jgi:pimeloyl-ACP methyl ester carboxylesterase